MKTYSTKANARRAAKSQGLDLNTLDFFELEENAWTWRVLAIDETSTEELSEQGYTEDSEAALAEEAGQLGGDQVLAEEYDGPEVAEAEAAPKLNKSTADRPCTLVWNIADAMPGAKRKEVIEACVKAGVAYYTARTQYQQWKSLQPK